MIEERVHQLYWEQNVNCARTMLLCLGELLHVPYEPQTLQAAVGLHGAGGYRAQCGLVEGALMFLGVYGSRAGKDEAEIVSACYRYADAFTKRFGALTCRDLRPGGFSPKDPPHLCERLTCETIAFTHAFALQLHWE